MLLAGAFLIAAQHGYSHVAAKNWMQMAVMRLFVGIAEAFTQGATLYLSFWYTNQELATRGAIFQSVSSLAGAFNGLLAYAIAKELGGHKGWASWKWIFFVEGVGIFCPRPNGVLI
jgi:MFS family permease